MEFSVYKAKGFMLNIYFWHVLKKHAFSCKKYGFFIYTEKYMFI